MATTPQPNIGADIGAILKGALSGLGDIRLPGEALVTAIVEAAIKDRESMNPVNRDQFDALRLEMAQDLYRFWKALMKPIVDAVEKHGQ